MKTQASLRSFWYLVDKLERCCIYAHIHMHACPCADENEPHPHPQGISPGPILSYPADSMVRFFQISHSLPPYTTTEPPELHPLTPQVRSPDTPSQMPHPFQSWSWGNNYRGGQGPCGNTRGAKRRHSWLKGGPWHGSPSWMTESQWQILPSLNFIQIMQNKFRTNCERAFYA